MIDKLKQFAIMLNKSGIPIPLIRLNGVPTFTGTLAFLSFNTALLGQLGKFTNLVGNVDFTQANYLFLICLGAYLGNKKLTGDGKNVSIEEIKTQQ